MLGNLNSWRKFAKRNAHEPIKMDNIIEASSMTSPRLHSCTRGGSNLEDDNASPGDDRVNSEKENVN